MRAAKEMRGGNLSSSRQYLFPFTVGSQQWWMQVVLFAVAAYNLFSFFTFIIKLGSYDVFAFRMFRFEWTDSIAFVDGRTASGSRTVQIQLQRRGCRVPMDAATFNASSTWMSITFQQLQEIDGFVLNRTLQDGTFRRSAFVLRGSNDGGETFQVIGSPSYRHTSLGLRFKNASATDWTQEIFDYRPPWPMIVDVIVTTLNFSLAMVSAAVCGRLRRPEVGKMLCVGFLLTETIACIIVAAGFLSNGMTKSAFDSLLLAIVLTGVSTFLQLWEKWCLDGAAVFSAFYVVLYVTGQCVLFADCPNLVEAPPATSATCTLVCGILILFRIRALRHAHTVLSADLAHRRAMLEHFLGANSEAAAQLDSMVSRMAGACPKRRVHQRNGKIRAVTRMGRLSRNLGNALSRTLSSGHALSRAMSSGHALSRAMSSIPHGAFRDEAQAAGSYSPPLHSPASFYSETDAAGPSESGDLSSPIVSLDQLYAQALGVARVLRSHSARWARAPGGA